MVMRLSVGHVFLMDVHSDGQTYKVNMWMDLFTLFALAKSECVNLANRDVFSALTGNQRSFRKNSIISDFSKDSESNVTKQ